MNIHKNARLTPLRREEMALAVIDGHLVTRASCLRLWRLPKDRFPLGSTLKDRGRAAMKDRSSRPWTRPRITHAVLAERIIELRSQRRTGKHIAMETGASPATVSRVLKRRRTVANEGRPPAEPIVRYEYAEPGGMIHLEIKRLGRFDRVGHRITGDRTDNSRGVGWEYVHVGIDDASRLAFTDIFPNEKTVSAIAFLKAAIAYDKSLGITVTRRMTDNGACYRAKDFAKAGKALRLKHIRTKLGQDVPDAPQRKALRLKHIRTKPYTPKTNGKAERFIQTALKEWAYACPYPSSEHRKNIGHTGRICIIGIDLMPG